MTGQWFESEKFWDVVAPIMFSRKRWSTAKEEVTSLLSLIKQKEPCRLLDQACGPGRHALEFARRGFDVTGVDRTAQYIDEAKKRASSENLEAQFNCEDMRTFKRPKAYDLIVNLFTSFGYFEDPADDRSALEMVHHSLSDNGTFVLDLAGKEILARVYKERDWSREDDGTLLIVERELRENWSWIVNRWFIVKDGQTHEYTFSHRLYSAAELTSLLREVGFMKVQVHGSLKGGPYDHRANRLVIVAKK